MDTIREAVESFRKAVIDANEAMLNDLMLDELSYGHTSGLIEGKRDFIDAIAGSNKRDVFKSIELSDHVIRVVGNTAIVRHKFTGEVLINGVLAKPDIRVLQVWCLRDGVWKLLARQAYKV